MPPTHPHTPPHTPPPHSNPPKPAAAAGRTPSLNTDQLLLIVVGAHPRAEQHDRAVGYRLRQVILDRLLAYSGQDDAEMLPFTPLVMSDVWYLNDPSLRSCPTICVGAPGVNALSAYLGDKLPSVFVIDDVLMVQLDLDLADLIACCWGSSPESTLAATDAFCEKYLDEFLHAALKRAQSV
jgi:hypothetical protein